MRYNKALASLMAAFSIVLLGVLLLPRATAAAGTTSIMDIQFTSDPSGDSPLVDQMVTVNGIVYAVFPDGFAIADATGAWNGIYVFLDAAPSVVVGDQVTVDAIVDEFFGRTTLGDGTAAITVSVDSSGNTPHAPTVVNTGDIATGADPAESYEGVYVEVQDVVVSDVNPDAPSDFGEWAVDDGSGEVRVDDLGFLYEPDPNEMLDFLRGMLYYSFGNFKITPAGVDDIGAMIVTSAVTIFEIQNTGDPSGDSPLAGEMITTTGVVYATYDAGSNSGYAIHEDSGAWHGIFVHTGSSGALPNIGDELVVNGTVAENFGLTRISNSSFSVTSTGNDLFDPVVLPTNDVADEMYEGVLVEVRDVTVTDPDLGFGEYEVDDGSGPVRVDDLGYVFEPVADEPLEYVRGMLNYSFGDFKIEPRDSFDVGAAAGCGDGATLIHMIQGDGTVSPLVGILDVTVEAVVVGDFQEGDELNGFFIQEEDADADGDMATSEGLWVFAPGSTDVAVGDLVRLRGDVSEFGSSGSTLTQLSDLDFLTICDSGQAVTPAEITLPLSSPDDLEQYEGMASEMPQTLYVTDIFGLGRFGEVVLSVGDRLFNPTQVAMPGGPATTVSMLNNRSRILLDDGSDDQNPDPVPHLGPNNTLRGGDTIEDVDGVVDQRFGSYRIQPTETLDFTRANPRESAPADVGGEMKVASFNVLNYFTTIDNGNPICGPDMDLDCRGADSVAELDRQRDKIVSALIALDADVVGLIEIENHATDAALFDLVDALNAAIGGGTYDYIPTGPIGDDAIKVAFIYDTATTMAYGDFAILDSSVDPTFLDSKNRPVLAQTFALAGDSEQRVTVAVNHLKSKGSACTDVGDPNLDDFQGNCNQTRTDAAIALANWLATDPTASHDADFLIIGDLNSYAMEDPIRALEERGYTDLAEIFEGIETYSFVFFGEWGTLDYAMANQPLLGQVTGATIWHISSDEPPALDYNEFNNPALYDTSPFRASDHDPVVVGLDLDATPQAALSVVKTVGLDADACAASEMLNVTAGTVVYYCYTVTNTGDLTLTTHTLADDKLGAIFTDLALNLGPGASINTVANGIIVSATIDAITTNTATWTASTKSGQMASDSAMAKVVAELPTDVSLSELGGQTALLSLWVPLLALATALLAFALLRRRDTL